MKVEPWKPPTAENVGKVDFKAEGEKKAEPKKAEGEVSYREEMKLGTIFDEDGKLYRNRMRKDADGNNRILYILDQLYDRECTASDIAEIGFNIYEQLKKFSPK